YDAGADGAGTLDVERSVADDPDPFTGNRRAHVAVDLGESLAGHVVAVEVMIAEAAEGEGVEEAEMGELGGGAGADVTGAEAGGEVGMALQPSQQFDHAGEDAAAVKPQRIGKTA